MNAKETAEAWHHAIADLHRAHFNAARTFQLRNKLLGVPALILSTFVGAAIFSTLESSPDIKIKILTGLLSVAAALFTGLQTFLSYGERSEEHKCAAVRYGRLRRILEEKLACEKDNWETLLNEIRLEWDRVDQETPPVPAGFYADPQTRRNG